MSVSKSRNNVLRKIAEGYLKTSPKLFLGDIVQELIENAPDLTDFEMEELGVRIFKDGSIAEVIAENRA